MLVQYLKLRQFFLAARSVFPIERQTNYQRGVRQVVAQRVFSCTGCG